jgi:hypothetical protein
MKNDPADKTETLEKLLNKLPYQVKIGNHTYQLIIFGYRNVVRYSVMTCKNTGELMLGKVLAEAVDGELIDNVKKMIAFLEYFNMKDPLERLNITIKIEMSSIGVLL